MRYASANRGSAVASGSLIMRRNARRSEAVVSLMGFANDIDCTANRYKVTTLFGCVREMSKQFF